MSKKETIDEHLAWARRKQKQINEKWKKDISFKGLLKATWKPVALTLTGIGVVAIIITAVAAGSE